MLINNLKNQNTQPRVSKLQIKLKLNRQTSGHQSILINNMQVKNKTSFNNNPKRDSAQLHDRTVI